DVLKKAQRSYPRLPGVDSEGTEQAQDQGSVEASLGKDERPLRLLWNNREQQAGLLLQILPRDPLQVAQPEEPEEVPELDGLSRKVEEVSVTQTLGFSTRGSRSGCT